MWPILETINPAAPYFEEKKRVAANVPAPGETGSYTLEMFSEDYPEFYEASLSSETGEPVFTPLLPDTIMAGFIDRANHSILPSRWGSDWRAAAGLFVAHFAALRLQTYAPGSTAAQTAAAAANMGTVKTAALGDTSVGYDNAAVTSGTEKWGSWNLTTYGMQLATMARMLGIAGMYVI